MEFGSASSWRALICFVVWIDGEPCFGSGGEAGVGRVVPLHGCAGIVAAGLAQVAEVFVFSDLVREDLRLVGVLHFDVVEVFDFVEGIVGHAELVALVDIGRSLEREEHGGESFC